jgi:hypothetical protein
MATLRSVHEELGSSSSSDLSAVAIAEAMTLRDEHGQVRHFIVEHAERRRSRDLLPYELLHVWPDTGNAKKRAE